MKTARISALLFILAASWPAVLPAYVTNQAADIVIGQPDMTSNASGVNANTLSTPTSVSSDGTRLFVADAGNSRVLIYNTIPAGNNATADIVLGQPNMTSNTGNTAANANTLNSPMSVYSDGTRLFVADYGNSRVLIYTTIPTTNFASANIVIGQPNMTSNTQNNGGVNANTLNLPIRVSGDGTRLFVADKSNSRILIYNTIPTTNGVSANIVIGQPNMTSNTQNNGGVNANTLYCPWGVYGDQARLFVADSDNSRALIYNTLPLTNGALANVVIGQPNMTSNADNNGGVNANANVLADPTGVYSDGARLFVADRFNHRVLIYNTIPTANFASADIVLGQPNMTSSAKNGPNANTLAYPSSVYSDSTRLFVAEEGHNRILIFCHPTQLASISPNYGMSGKIVQITVSSDEYINTASPAMTLARSGFPNIVNTSVLQNNSFNYTYTFDLTNAAPNCYDVTVTANTYPRSLKQTFTVLSPIQAPIEWKINDLGQISSQTTITIACGLAIGDADQDNNQELYVSNQGAALYQVKLDHGWSKYPVPNGSGVSGASFNGLLLADDHGDQTWEIYGTSADNHVYEFKTAAWQTTDLGAAGTGGLCGLAGLDADHDGIPEIYVSTPNGHIFQIKRNSGSVTDITPGGFTSGQGNALAAGDGNNDHTLKLYSANSDYKLYQYVFDGVAWQVATLGTATGVMYSVSVGDGDNDGKNEVYGASQDGYVYQARWNGSTWNMHSIGLRCNGALYAVAVSDGENAGSNQVYAACGDGHVYEFKYQSGNWATIDLGSANTPLYTLAIGDADNDHHFEVYALGQNNHVFQFKAGSILAPLATTTPTIIPAITVPQNYFKIFHSQINPLHGEQARIRWCQPQTGAVSITVYNLLGDKVIGLVNHEEYASGQYNEVKWNGSGQNGKVCGSGIYIVLWQGPGYQEKGKIAVIK